MRIFIITMEDPLYTLPFIKDIIKAKKKDIVGLAISEGGRLKIGKNRSKLMYLLSLLLIMGIGGFVKKQPFTSRRPAYFCQVRFLWRFALRRFRRLCFDIFRRRFFLRFPMVKVGFRSANVRFTPGAVKHNLFVHGHRQFLGSLREHQLGAVRLQRQTGEHRHHPAIKCDLGFMSPRHPRPLRTCHGRRRPAGITRSRGARRPRSPWPRPAAYVASAPSLGASIPPPRVRTNG